MSNLYLNTSKSLLLVFEWLMAELQVWNNTLIAKRKWYWVYIPTSTRFKESQRSSVKRDYTELEGEMSAKIMGINMGKAFTVGNGWSLKYRDFHRFFTHGCCLQHLWVFVVTWVCGECGAVTNNGKWPACFARTVCLRIWPFWPGLEHAVVLLIAMA